MQHWIVPQRHLAECTLVQIQSQRPSAAPLPRRDPEPSSKMHLCEIGSLSVSTPVLPSWDRLHFIQTTVQLEVRKSANTGNRLQPSSPAAFCWSCSPHGQKQATLFIWRTPYWREGDGKCAPLRRCHLISWSSCHGLQEQEELLMPFWDGKFNSQLAKAVTALSRIKCTAENNFVFLPSLCWVAFPFNRS